jgi:hypothetical protein
MRSESRCHVFPLQAMPTQRGGGIIGDYKWRQTRVFMCLIHSCSCTRVEDSPDSSQALTWGLSKMAFPNAYNFPTHLSQAASCLAITCSVPLNLVLPLRRVGSRGDVLAATVPMPETSVYEDGYLGLEPDKIRVSKQRLTPSPTGQAGSSKQRGQTLLSCLVSCATYTGHQLPARQPAKRSPL